MKVFPTLYKKSKTGKIEQWDVQVKDNIITVCHGYNDGKKQINERLITEGKNIGKSNQTTLNEQALLEAESDWNKKKDKGYATSIEDTENLVILPMLALDFHKRGHSITYPCYAQRKLDGARCIANVNNPVLLTRGGKEFTQLPHIVEAIRKLSRSNVYSDTLYLDGELYSHELSLQQIAHIIKQTKKKAEGFEKIQYRIYDCFTIDNLTIPFETRLQFINSLPLISPLQIVETTLVQSKDLLPTIHAKYVSEGYEGLMLRNMQGTYNLGHRSSDLQKYKAFDSTEFEIIGFKEGEGLEKGCVIWTCATKERKEFDCRPKGTREARKELFIDGKSYIGKSLTVKHFGYSDDNIPIFPVGEAIRDYE